MSEVYDRFGGIVKYATIATLIVLPALLIGCRAPRFGHDFAMFATWYDASQFEEKPSEGVESDLELLASLGFNTVFLRGGDTSSGERFARLARLHGLHASAINSDMDRYISRARLPFGWITPLPLTVHTRDTSVDIVYFGEVSDLSGVRRLHNIATYHHAEKHVPWSFATISDALDISGVDPGTTVYCSEGDYLGESSEDDLRIGNLLILSARQFAGPAISTSSWLGAYHAGLTEGRVAGVVVADMLGETGLMGRFVGPRSTSDIRIVAGFKRLRKRVKRWGPRLRECKVQIADPLEDSAVSIALADADNPVTVAWFTGPSRRYVMVYNRSDSAFVRNPITIRCPGEIDRLVEIPVENVTIVGDVHRVNASHVTLQTALAPRDARLYEAF